MTIISAARNISLHADMLRTMIDQTGTAHDLLAAVHDGNRQLSANITEILGQVQFQDVVRQRVERAILSMQQRNVVFKEMLQSIELSGLNLTAFADNMRTVLEQYLQNEKLHAAALNHGVDQDVALPKIEFF
jgi:methyl-accepting chemotaxis protein